MGVIGWLSYEINNAPFEDKDKDNKNKTPK